MGPFPAMIRSLKTSPTWFTNSRIGLPTNFIHRYKSLAGLACYGKPITKEYTDHLENYRLDEARAAFDKLSSPNIYICTKMIAGYVKNSRLSDALKLFDEMPVRDTVMWNLIIRGCLDCGDLGMGRKLFDEMPDRNVISWTTMINGFLRVGEIELAERFFCRMPVRDIAAWNSMIYGYFSNNRVEDAVKLFKVMPCRNVISWTSMISGLDQHGKSDDSLILFKRMSDGGVQPTSTTYSSVITACANVMALRLGVQVHGNIVKQGYMSDAYVTASLVTFYAHCKEISFSTKVFNEKLHMNVVVWTALLTGYGLNSRHEEALEVFGGMFKMGVLPNQSSFTSALNSCCEMEALDRGKGINAVTIKLGLDTDVFVGNSLVVLYSKCGNIGDAMAIFKEISGKNIVSWNTAIVGCAQHGCGIWALTLFNRMLRDGMRPDDITFTGLLSACSHSGMLQKGRRFFKCFSKDESVELKLEHYACMVDILGRSGNLEEAEDLVKSMPLEANLSIWLALLSGCRMHSNLEVAERASKGIFDLDPDCSAAYTLLSNLYAFAGRWSDAAKVRGMMKSRCIVKQPGRSWVTLKGQRHAFLSGDRSHPLNDKIYKNLDWLGERLKEFGYVPDERFALHDVEDEQKEVLLSYHSERLAISFALICTPVSSKITVMKNLRVCGDCHSAIKLIAKVVEREIVLRDSSRFHHFRDGFCSCKDYW